MLNGCHVEGFVTKKQWTYAGDKFFRIAIYRDPDRPRKESENSSQDKRDKPDYVTVKVPAANYAGLIQLTPGQRVQVHGWLESREYEYSLADFLEDAKAEPEITSGKAAEETTAHRGTTWIVAERITLNEK